jgi:hypothetical protein
VAAPAASATGGEENSESAPQRYLSKPFQYADLLRAIETLIAQSDQ